MWRKAFYRSEPGLSRESWSSKVKLQYMPAIRTNSNYVIRRGEGNSGLSRERQPGVNQSIVKRLKNAKEIPFVEFPFNTVITEENVPKWNVGPSGGEKQMAGGVDEVAVRSKQEVTDQTSGSQRPSKDFDKSKEKLSEVKITGDGKEETGEVENAEKIREPIEQQRNKEAI